MSQSLTIETAVVKVPGSTQRDKINPLESFTRVNWWLGIVSVCLRH